PLVAAMNGLFSRIETTLARERRFTADAAHELRTPLAVLRAQWDVVRRAEPGAARDEAEAKLGQGMERLDRLVTQMLALSRLEAGSAAPAMQEVAWPAVVEQAMSDCLPLAERRRVELACEGLEGGARPPLPLRGDMALLTVLLRNLLDNAVRYAPAGGTVTLRFGEHALEVENDAQPMSDAQLARLGERFYRPDGQDEIGSGLGLSIVQRIAALHGMSVRFARRADGRGLRVIVGF
ncbi:MAG: ATP-binding protein, partial [Piscinibacter sp.]